MGVSDVVMCNIIIVVIWSIRSLTYAVGDLADETMVNLKVVDEPTNYGANLLGYQQAHQARSVPKTHVSPANFSGPLHLRRLHGKCFTELLENYNYKICPFANITQHEEAMRWNAYSGVLGVWQEWHIENNTFVSMKMNEGDLCGDHRRTTKVELVCSNRTEILSVREPRTCEYASKLGTPLVCHPDSMLVYPTLSTQLQDEWDTLEGLLQRNFITAKGYTIRLQELYIRAGYQLSATQRESLVGSKTSEIEQKSRDADDFDTFPQCQSEYRKLKQKLEKLQNLLEEQDLNRTALIAAVTEET